MVWFPRGSSVGEELALHADICNLHSGFLATEYNELSLKSRQSRPKYETKQS